MEEPKIKVRILPLHNIGGVGKAGDVVWMSAADAEMYVREGYVEVVSETTPAPDPHPALPQIGEHDLGEGDHKILKPQSKRSKRK